MKTEIEEIKYDIISHLGRHTKIGTLPALTIETLFEGKRRNYINRNFFISFEIFTIAIKELIKQKILISRDKIHYRLTDDFFWEPDAIERYKYIRYVLTQYWYEV